MGVSLKRLDPTGVDRADLIAFLIQHTFPFHVRPRLTREQVEGAIDGGAYDGDENQTFWLLTADAARVGIVRLEDLGDSAPLFDLRLGESERRRGLGAQALRATTEHVFTTWPQVHRFEGQTREDNIAMRRIFVRQGWVKEAHYREAWPVEGGEPVASIAYAILRRDWARGEVTHLTWDDLAL